MDPGARIPLELKIPAPYVNDHLEGESKDEHINS